MLPARKPCSATKAKTSKLMVCMANTLARQYRTDSEVTETSSQSNNGQFLTACLASRTKKPTAFLPYVKGEEGRHYMRRVDLPTAFRTDSGEVLRTHPEILGLLYSVDHHVLPVRDVRLFRC